MLAVKLHLLASILVTQALALWDSKRLPYFPIEISRTAASSLLATRSLQFGFTTLLVTMLLSGAATWARVLMWAGLMVVAFVPDTLHKALHIGGVLIMFAGAAADLAWTGRVYYVFVGVVIYALRTVFLFTSLLLIDEHFQHDTWRFTDTAFIKKVAARHHAIMFLPREEFPPGTYPARVIPYCKVSGVGQWVAFFVVSLAF